MQRLQRYASLDLRFAETKSLVDAVSGQNLITFTRASSGTFVDAAGVLQTAATDVARFDHNPTTGESLGLLVEEQRTNLLLRSEEFDNASWSNTGLVAYGSGSVANTTATTAPNDTFTAEKIVETSGDTTHFTAQTLTIVNATVYTLSVYAKAAERSRVALYFGGAGGAAQGIIVNLSNGTFAANIVAAPTRYSIAPAGNGWYRISITATSAGTAANHSVYICDNSNAFSYTGNGTSGIYIWGAQLEAGAFPTSYIPTTTAAVTRSADVASITGANFSSWYRQDEGTVLIEYRDNGVGGNRSPYFINDGTLGNRIGLFLNGSTTINHRIIASGAATNPGSLSSVLNQRNKHALTTAIGADRCIAVSNGTLSTSSSPVSNPAVTRLDIGTGPGGTLDWLNATVARIVFWPARLSNANLRALTQ